MDKAQLFISPQAIRIKNYFVSLHFKRSLIYTLRMMKKFTILLLMALATPLAIVAQKVDAKAYYTDSDGSLQETNSISEGQAPLEVTFKANPTEMEDFNPSYEWHFRKMDGTEGYKELFVRYEEETQYTFNESGTFNVVLKTFLNDEAVADPDSMVVTVSILESRLEFPNAFSPNEDGINDFYAAKGAKINGGKSANAYRSIVEFHAYIFNRWGKKLFEWTDIDDGWDGKYNGKDVSEGVYYVLVKAKGADGHHYNIRKDVNLLRGYTEGGNGSGTGTTTD